MIDDVAFPAFGMAGLFHEIVARFGGAVNLGGKVEDGCGLERKDEE
jgi:hypothetical protein